MRTNAHIESSLPIKGRSIPVDENTVELFHYDISANGALRGTRPLGAYVDDSTVLCYDMGETFTNSRGTYVVDKSPRGNYGKVNGATLVGGRNGKALSFDGIDDYIEISEFQMVNNSSIAMWYYWTGTSLEMPFGKIDIDNYFGLQDGSTYLIQDNNNTNISWTPAPLKNQWTHIVLTRKENNWELFVNGVSLGIRPVVGEFYINAIGNGYTGSTYAFTGKIDKVIIYNRALSSEEILSHYNEAIYTIEKTDGKFSGSIAISEATNNIMYFENPRIDQTYEPYVATALGTWQAKHPDAITVYNINGINISSYINTGVTDWTNTYHAIWTYDNELGKPVVTMRDVDGVWKAKYRGLGKSMNALGLGAGSKYTISWLQWTEDVTKTAQAGLYGQNNSATNGFHDGQSTGKPSAYNTKPYVWQRVYATFTVNSIWNMDANLTLFMYGTVGPRKTLKISDLQIEPLPCPTLYSEYKRERGLLLYNNPLPSSSEFTVSMWLKLQEKSTTQQYETIMTINNGVDANSVYVDYYNNTTLRFFTYNSAGVVQLIECPGLNIRGTWTHIAIKRSSTHLTAYINGKPAGSIANSGTVVLEGYMELGTRSTLPNNKANVLIDELRIDKIARTDEEILSWYESGAPFFPIGNERIVY